MKSGNLKFLEPSGPLRACNGTALPFIGADKDPEVPKARSVPWVRTAPQTYGILNFLGVLMQNVFEYSSSAERNTSDTPPEVWPASSQGICQCIFVNSSIKLLKTETNKINYN